MFSWNLISWLQKENKTGNEQCWVRLWRHQGTEKTNNRLSCFKRRLPRPPEPLHLQDICRILYNDVKLFLFIGFDSIVYTLLFSRWYLILVFYSVERTPHKRRFALRLSLQHFIGWTLSHSLYFNKWQKRVSGNLSPDICTRCLDKNRQACRIIVLMLGIWQYSKILVFWSLSYCLIPPRAWR